MTKTTDKVLKKGEIWLLSNPERIKEIGKDFRPVLVISKDERNEYSNSVVVLPLTTDDLEHISLTEVFVNDTRENGLDYPSKIQCESPFTWNKGIRFERKLGIASEETMKQVKTAWQIAFDWGE